MCQKKNGETINYARTQRNVLVVEKFEIREDKYWETIEEYEKQEVGHLVESINPTRGAADVTFDRIC